MRFILNILGVIALYVVVGVLEFTSSNLKEIDAQEIARPPGALDGIVEIAGVGFAGGILGGGGGDYSSPVTCSISTGLVWGTPNRFGRLVTILHLFSPALLADSRAARQRCYRPRSMGCSSKEKAHFSDRRRI